MNKIFITGCAGFIGSNLVDKLLENNYVVGWDNFSTGHRNFLNNALNNERFTLITGDNLNQDKLTNAMSGCDIVYHLAANADVRSGFNHPYKDLEQNTIATFNVLESMRKTNIKKIVFSSTGVVYGDTTIMPTPETSPFPIQTSLYGTSKVSCEGLISSYCEGFDFEGYIFRFVSVLGERYTHGHIYDFYNQIINHPEYLEVLGDGSQKKSYLYVMDCVDAMRHIVKLNDTSSKVQIFNLGTNEYKPISESISFICKTLSISPTIIYKGGSRGWIGDNPFTFLDTSKIRNTGWNTKLNIEESILKTLTWLSENKWVYNYRK